jgi:WD40 repeat protein
MSSCPDFAEKLLSFNRYSRSEKGQADLLRLQKDISVAEKRLNLLLEGDLSVSPDSSSFALGCKSLHRGPMSPDLLKNIILSKKEKGRILKTKSKNSSFSYAFSGNGKLISVSALDKGTLLSTEKLFYKKDAVFGITFAPSGEAIAFSEERFKENLLIRYSFYNIKEGKIVSVRKTVFGYEKGKISRCYELKLYEDGSLFRTDFEFHRTSSGYLRSYSVFDFSENGKTERASSPFSLPPYLEF